MDPDPTDRPVVRLVFVGHVDHGKSTLIGRLMYETGALPASRLADMGLRQGRPGASTDFARVTDHLREERQGRMTLDTAEVSFASPARRHVLIDAPGHRRFLRNMVTGASQADAGVLVLDACEGAGEQTYRHACLLGLLGVAQVVVAVNKMDLVGWARGRFEQVRAELEPLLARAGVAAACWVPVSAREGDNVTRASRRLPWHAGPTLLEALDALAPPAPGAERPLRMPVQDRYDVAGREVLVGRVAAGIVRAGGPVRLIPSGRRATVLTVEVFGQDPRSAEAGESIGLTVDVAGVARGEVVCGPDRPALSAEEFAAGVFWLADRALRTGEPLQLNLATAETTCRIVEVKQVIDSATLAPLPQTDELRSAQVGRVVIRTERPLAVECFAVTAELGRFVLSREGEVQGGGIVTGLGGR